MISTEEYNGYKIFKCLVTMRYIQETIKLRYEPEYCRWLIVWFMLYEKYVIIYRKCSGESSWQRELLGWFPFLRSDKWKNDKLEECWFLESYCVPVHGVVKAVQGEFCVLKYGDQGFKVKRYKAV